MAFESKMAQQMLLPLARPGDPETSQEAAEDLVQSGVWARMCRVALELLREYPGQTAAELDRIYTSRTGRLLDGSIRKRLTDLRHAGRAKVEGRRRCGVTGRRAQLWFPVTKG